MAEVDLFVSALCFIVIARERQSGMQMQYIALEWAYLWFFVADHRFEWKRVKSLAYQI